MRPLCLLLLAPSFLCAQPLAEKVDAILRSSAAATTAYWGMHAINLSTGETLVALKPDRYFMPASTAKLFSTALALESLGPDHRFVTLVTADSSPDSSGRLAGELRLIGGGDPTLSARTLPYKPGAVSGNPLQAIEELADQVVARGVRRIQGDIVGDDTAYPWEPYPEGRAQDDALWDYGAPVSALAVSENGFSLTVIAGRRVGALAQIRLLPALEYFAIENRVRTTSGGPAKISLERLPGSRQVRVWGVMPLKAAPASWRLGIEDPAEFAAVAFCDALTRRGVAITGKPVARHRFADEVPDLKLAAAPVAKPGGVELARRVSPPLVEILQVADKESLNLYAELVLREVGRVRRNIGSRQAGLQELQAFLRSAGVPEGECALVDGSGLSALDLVTPRAVTALLLHMYNSPNREAWISMLPEGGRDGTLTWRFKDGATAGRIHAKTGTMAHVSALAGYAQTSSGDPIAFSILANNYTAPASGIRAVIDAICAAVVGGDP